MAKEEKEKASKDRLNACWVKDQDMNAKGGSWSNRGGEGPKGQGSHQNGQQFNNGHCQVRSLESCYRGGVWEWRQGKGHLGKGGTYCFGGVSPQGGSQDGGGTLQAVSSNPWTSYLFLLEDKPRGPEKKNSFGALEETSLENEVPRVSYDDFP